MRSRNLQSGCLVLFVLLSSGISCIAQEAPAGLNSFGFALFTNLIEGKLSENTIISPLSIDMALTMVWNGSANGTRSAMERVMGLKKDSDSVKVSEAWQKYVKGIEGESKGFKLNIANSLWIQDGQKLNPNFIHTSVDLLNAEVQQIDLENSVVAAALINKWVSDKTAGKITKAVSPDALSITEMVLINAVYFKAEWLRKFDSTYTVTDSFTLLNGQKKSVKMMGMFDNIDYIETPDIQMMRKPYVGNSVDAVILLPRKNVDAAKLLKNLNLQAWNEFNNQMRSHQVLLSLPKVKLEYSTELIRVLAKMGMGKAFSNLADLSGMFSPPKGLYIGTAIHKTTLEINEENTEATAVTVMTTDGASETPREILTMRVDHPYIFALQDHKTGGLLFLGWIANP